MSDSSAEPPQFPPGYLEANEGNQVIAAASFILVLTTILLAMRLYARSLTKATRGWDEFLLVPSYMCLVGLIICLYCRCAFSKSTGLWSISSVTVAQHRLPLTQP